MTRSRDWPANTYAEVFVRLDHGQKIAHVARATRLTYQQVLHFSRQLKDNPEAAPPNTELPSAEDVEVWHGKIAAEEEAKAAGTPDELEAEVNGCIELVKAAAAQFKMTPRKFLWLAMTSARSAV